MFAKGAALAEQGKWTEAIAAYRKCVELDPKNSKAWHTLGFAYYTQNGNKPCAAADESWMRCIALDPKHVAAHYSLGSTAGLRKDYARAEEMYRKAIELDPSDAYARQRLADISSSNNRGCACSVQ